MDAKDSRSAIVPLFILEEKVRTRPKSYSSRPCLVYANLSDEAFYLITLLSSNDLSSGSCTFSIEPAN